MDETVGFSDFWKNYEMVIDGKLSINEFYYNIKPTKISVDNLEVPGLWETRTNPRSLST